MNFTKLKKEICNEIESILVRRWGSLRLPDSKPRPRGVRAGTGSLLPGRLQQREGEPSQHANLGNGRAFLRDSRWRRQRRLRRR